MLPIKPRKKGQWACDVWFHGGYFQRGWNVFESSKDEERNMKELGYGLFHHDGLHLCSVLLLGYLAEVHTAAFSTDPCFGWPPLHCLVAIQIVWERVLRHQWSWK